MKKHYLLALFATLALGFGVQAQTPDTLTVAEGSASLEVVPLNHQYTSVPHHSQIIYPAEMLQDLEGNMIDAMVFHMTMPSVIYNGTHATVRLGSTTQTAYAGNDTLNFLPLDGMTVVFDSVLSADSNLLPITFNEPYLYAGGNLVVDIVYAGDGPLYGWYGQFFGISVEHHAAIWMYTEWYEGQFYFDCYVQNVLPMVDFLYEAGGDICLSPTAPVTDNITPHTADISWTPRNTEQTYILSLNGEVIEENWTTASYSATGLDPETQYTFGVRALCSEGDTSAALTTTFTTTVACPAPTGFTLDSVDAEFVIFHWNNDETAESWQILVDGQVVEESWGDTSYTVFDLTHSHAYRIGLRALCGEEGGSQLFETTVATACVPIDAVPFTFDFEDNYLGCWTIDNGNWEVGASTTNAVAHGGTRMLRNDIAFHAAGNYVDGPFTIRMPQIVVPEMAEGLQLTWYAAGQNTGLSAETPCTYEVLVTASTLGLNDIVVLRDTLTINNDYHQAVLDLSPYAGMTINVGFRHTTAQVSGVRTWLQIDDLKLNSTEQPDPVIGRYSYRYGSPDAYVMVGDEARFEAMLAGGSDLGLEYSWNSTMADAGLATLSTDDGVLTIVYDATGRDTITLTATNSYGTATTTLGVEVVDFTLATLPFNANFNITSTYAQEFAKWCDISLDNTTTSAFRLITQTHSGIYALGSYALPDTGQTDAMLISPAIAVPTTALNMSLIYYVRGNTADSTLPATYELLVSTSGRSSYTYFTDTILRDTVMGSVYQHRSVPLSGYAGDTVYLAFRHTSVGAQLLGIDDIAIREAAEPVVNFASHPQTVDAGDTVILTAILEEGLNEGVVYSWTSSMFTAGHADTVMLYDSVMSIVYTDGGTDNITVNVTSPFGNDSRSTNLTVRNCQPIDELPWQPYFNNINMLCWDIHDIDGDNRTWMTTSDGKLYSRDNANGPNDWAVTPAIVIPADGDSIVLDYIVEGNTWNGLMAHYELYVSPSGDPQLTAFTDTLLVEDIDSTARRIIALNDYVGNTVRFAFRHVNTGDDNGLRIGNLSVREFNPPMVTIEAPESAIAESDAIFHAMLINGDTTSVTYTWTSTMADAGLATLIPNGADLTINYLGAGTDTIGVTADNGYGTSSATVELVVQPAPCHTPTSLVLDSAGADFLAMSWQPGADESQWEISVNDEATIVEQASYTATGLTPSTSYIISVRAICSEGDTSLTLSALFTTADSTVTPPTPPDDSSSIVLASDAAFSLYPNPASQVVTVNSATAADVAIIDLNGRECGKWRVENDECRMDVSDLPRGAYFVRLTSAQGTAVRKLIIR